MKDGAAMFDADNKGFVNAKDLGRVGLELGDKQHGENFPELE